MPQTGGTIARRIRASRHRQGLSQEKLAELLGTSRRHVIRWENGHTRPGPGYAAKLAQVLGEDAKAFHTNGKKLR